MEQLKTYAPLITRLFLAAMFIPAGLGKMGDVAGFAGYLTSGGLPAFLAWPSIIFEVLLGLSMLIGFQARWMALLGAGFCVVAGLLYHFAPADQMQMIMFFKNLGVAGAFLMIFAHGPGKLSVDKV
ncbi:MAG: DoxX family protein [Tabrizicola sp.]|uniref:DoxX family protein n=1 Tax=Tabrizicola sp. TaxID=2005166 RepID=UPI002ABBA5F9|nr:DoxX family protein [Tabrizicola sp.]MDZ4086113.1 DoxX family protein [Tabrizicola sp.]